MKNMKIMKITLPLFSFLVTAGFTYAHDWANTARFKEANAKLAPPAAGETRVVFMGNSITEGWINTCPEFFAGKPYINRGIS